MNISKKNIIGQLLILTVAILFGLVGFLTKQVSGYIHPIVLAFYRVLFAFLLMLFVVPLMEKRVFNPGKLELKHSFLLAIFFISTMTAYLAALQFTSIQNVALLNSTAPFFVLILAYFLLKEKITRLKVIVLALGAIGLFIINPLTAGAGLLGNLLALFSGVSFATLIVFMRKFERRRDLKILVWLLFFSTLLLLPSIFIWGLGDLATIWPQVLIMGLACTGLAYLCFTVGVEYIESETASIVLMIGVPVVSIVLGYFIINESLVPQTLIGGSILIAAGIIFELFAKKKKKQKKVKHNKLKFLILSIFKKMHSLKKKG